MIFLSKKKSTLTLKALPPLGRDHFTNSDVIQGTIVVEAGTKLVAKSLKVIFYGLSVLQNPDVIGTSTYNSSERHYCVKIEDVILSESDEGHYIAPGLHQFDFEIRIPSFDLQLPCHGKCHLANNGEDPGLPPTFKYTGTRSTIDIKYGIRAFLERHVSKPDLFDSTTVKFVPALLFTSFAVSHSRDFAPCKRSETLEFSTKRSEPKSSKISRASGRSKDASPPPLRNLLQLLLPTSITDSLYRVDTHSSGSLGTLTAQTLVNSGLVRSFFGSSGSSLDHPVPLNVSVHFKQNVYRNFDEKGVLRHHGLLSDHMRLIISSTTPPGELLQGAEPRFSLSHLIVKLKLVTRLRTIKETNIEFEEKFLLNNKDTVGTVNVMLFRRVSQECRTWYQYELDPALFKCIIDSDVPSFKFCNAEREYQLIIQGDLKGCDTTRRFSMNADVVILA